MNFAGYKSQISDFVHFNRPQHRRHHVNACTAQHRRHLPQLGLGARETSSHKTSTAASVWVLMKWPIISGFYLEKEMATLSSVLAWRIAWTEEPGGLQSPGSQRVGHD